MKIKNVFSAKGLAFIALFSLLSIVASTINFSPIFGTQNQFFTFFQFIGPIAGAFIGAGAGVISVFIAQLASFFLLGKEIEIINVLRLFPMLFAAFYFAKYSHGKLSQALVPLLCIGLFVLHPVGAQAWIYSLYWLIPAIALLLPENLFFRSIGSTFTAHAIGGIIWIYFLPTTPEFWIALIPIVAFERTLFALGISASYIAFNTIFALSDLTAKSHFISIDRRYVLFTLH